MSDVGVKLSWNGGMKFTAVNASGHETVIDGDKKTAASPVEILLEALGACTAADVVMILEKMRTPAQRFELTLDGNRHTPEPRYYTEVRVRFDVWGDGINPDKLARAINLSFGKYCSVYHSLRPDLKTQAEFRLHAPDAEVAGEYHIVDLVHTSE
ncbi:MAG: OsmC family protein [Acidobacteria bacterium]|nr:OsmC family protein [Acidobacteriota bacterium]MCI0663206.1 OsmC family protein [Acidobacteriota bacterium]